MRKKRLSQILIYLVILNVIVSPLTGYEIQEINENPGPFFSISLLCPNNYNFRWVHLLPGLLPKIGIGITTFDHTGWYQISSRTWDHPGPYPIPTYAEGGYDILLVGWLWGLDFDPTGLYDSPAITPNGYNFYQYNSTAMDNAIEQYASSFVAADRIEWAHEIQDLLYEDLPQISVFNPCSVYAHTINLTDFEAFLWHTSQYPFWKTGITGQTTFKYAFPSYPDKFHILTCWHRDWSTQYLRQIYNRLIERDPEYGNYFGPWLSDSFRTTDGITYTVDINPKAKWADGTDITVEDVIYTYQLIVTPTLESPLYSTAIKYWDNNSIIKTGDDQFTIAFKQPFLFHESNLAFEILPKHIWEEIPPENHSKTAADWFLNHPEKIFGAGPYKLHEYNSTSNYIHLKVNTFFEEWKGVAPKFTDFYFIFYSSSEAACAALTSGAVDMVDERFIYSLTLIPPGKSFTSVENPSLSEIAINMHHPYLGTGEKCPIGSIESAKHVRKAISHIIPRDIICTELFNGLAVPASTGFPRGVVGFNRDLQPYSYDMNLARYHMAMAGFPIKYTPIDSKYPTLIIGITIPTIFVFLSLLGGMIIFSRKAIKEDNIITK